mgnify:CR=1 FL=1
MGTMFPVPGHLSITNLHRQEKDSSAAEMFLNEPWSPSADCTVFTI